MKPEPEKVMLQRRREEELTGMELIGEEEERRWRDVDRRRDPETSRDFWKQNDKKMNLFLQHSGFNFSPMIMAGKHPVISIVVQGGFVDWGLMPVELIGAIDDKRVTANAMHTSVGIFMPCDFSLYFQCFFSLLILCLKRFLSVFSV
ncbi:hypothetical protein F2Q70_00000245 [Brassica cretica]|uniref:Uncharacterized protein n=1 Tax=Brassica cretica TaxID=69181 RepID=A0A8S9J162_BRACR|nr:hypothetical protein F2Q70_00000245 [Brassica cretica]